MQTINVDQVSPDGTFVAHLVVGRADLEIGYRRVGLQQIYNEVMRDLGTRAAQANAALVADENNEQLRMEYLEAEKALANELRFERNYLRSRAYPDYVGATVEAEVIIDGIRQPWPPSFEQFISWPEQYAMELHEKWANAVYELNPHWMHAVVSEEKKRETPTPSTSNSPSTSKRKKAMKRKASSPI